MFPDVNRIIISPKNESLQNIKSYCGSYKIQIKNVYTDYIVLSIECFMKICLTIIWIMFFFFFFKWTEKAKSCQKFVIHWCAIRTPLLAQTPCHTTTRYSLDLDKRNLAFINWTLLILGDNSLYRGSSIWADSFFFFLASKVSILFCVQALCFRAAHCQTYMYSRAKGRLNH